MTPGNGRISSPTITQKPPINSTINDSGSDSESSSGDDQDFATPHTEASLPAQPDEGPFNGNAPRTSSKAKPDVFLSPPPGTPTVDYSQQPLPAQSPTLIPADDQTKFFEIEESGTLKRPTEAETLHNEKEAVEEETRLETSQEVEEPVKEVVEEVAEEEWDFILPILDRPATLTPGIGEGQDGFNLNDLVGAIQNGASFQSVENYLQYYDSDTVKRNLSHNLGEFPSIFFAAASNNDLILRTWVTHGGDVNAFHEKSQVPLLAFAIMNDESCPEDTTLIVATLLSLGADPGVIPSAFYSPYCNDLPDNGPDDEAIDNSSNENTKWCTTLARAKLAKTANLTQRYYLERASKTKKPTRRQREVATRRDAEALLGIPYFLIGQKIAADRLLQKLLAHLVVKNKRPMVLVFAGPSGHGKTEMARRLGHLLSLELQVVDCTIHSREIELFGPRQPYQGSERGTPLNNFLARKAGEKCIVFLDEFEKTTTEIHQALLVPFDNGKFSSC